MTPSRVAAVHAWRAPQKRLRRRQLLGGADDPSLTGLEHANAEPNTAAPKGRHRTSAINFDSDEQRPCATFKARHRQGTRSAWHVAGTGKQPVLARKTRASQQKRSKRAHMTRQCPRAAAGGVAPRVRAAPRRPTGNTNGERRESSVFCRSWSRPCGGERTVVQNSLCAHIYAHTHMHTHINERGMSRAQIGKQACNVRVGPSSESLPVDLIMP